MSNKVYVLRMSLPIAVILLSLCHQINSEPDCTVTQTVTFWNCVNYCWNTYNGTRDFYQFSDGQCLSRVVCGKGYYNDYLNNICIDEFGGHILKQLGFIVKVKEEIIRFVSVNIVHGYYAGSKLICDVGWKSSMTSYKKSNISTIVYLCDQEIKDGQIYPTTHGEYFFQKYTFDQQVLAMDKAFGKDNFESFRTVQAILFIIFTCVYTLCNFIAFSLAVSSTLLGNKSLFKNKNQQINDKRLTEQQKQEIKEFLQKRKEQRQKALGQIKYFSIKQEIIKQVQKVKQIKAEGQQLLMKKFRKKIIAKKQTKSEQIKSEQIKPESIKPRQFEVQTKTQKQKQNIKQISFFDKIFKRNNKNT